MSDRRSVLNLSVSKGAKKKVCNSENWKDNVAKAMKQSGQEYVSKKKKQTKPGKNFIPVESCCNEKCFEKISETDQRELFHLFYDSGAKKVQDTHLASCMTLSKSADRSKKVENPKVNRECAWKYSIKCSGVEISICRQFLVDIYQVGIKRIRLLQKKVLEQTPLDDLRGKHGKQRKIEGNVYQMALEHLKSIPNKHTHYTPQKTNRLYFANSDLTIKEIFSQFQVYFKEATRTNLTMKYKTYFKFFRETPYTFKKPKTDTCDYCRECEVKLEMNPLDPCHVEFTLHKKRVEAYEKLKTNVLSSQLVKDNETLVLEFDYAQNLPLPKLSVTKQFYKRLLWMYLFNVHVHNDDSSFVYTFFESECKKGANTVASFLFHCIQKKLTEFNNVKHIVLLSDSAGGQNKNQTLLRFCSWIAKMLNEEITHVYPVRGHSFSQCDRNFGVIRKSLKKLETIEHPKGLWEEIVLSRQNPSPFNLLHDPSIVYNWDLALIPHFLATPKSKGHQFRIQQYKIIKYKACGTLSVSKSYLEVYTPFQYLFSMPPELTLDPMPRVPLKQAKIKDIKSLFNYMNQESRDFYDELFEETNKLPELQRASVNDNDPSSEDTDDDEL